MTESEVFALTCWCHDWFHTYHSDRCMELKAGKLWWRRCCRLRGSGPELQARWGFRSQMKGGNWEWKGTHQQGDDVCKGMEGMSLEIRVQWPKTRSPSSPGFSLWDGGMMSHSCRGFDPGSKSLDMGKPLSNLLFLWTRVLLGDEKHPEPPPSALPALSSLLIQSEGEQRWETRYVSYFLHPNSAPQQFGECCDFLQLPPFLSAFSHGIDDTRLWLVNPSPLASPCCFLCLILPQIFCFFPGLDWHTFLFNYLNTCIRQVFPSENDRTHFKTSEQRGFIALRNWRAQDIYLASGTAGSRCPVFLGSSFHYAGILAKLFSCDGKMRFNHFVLMAPWAEQLHFKDVCSFQWSSGRFFDIHSNWWATYLLGWGWGEWRWEKCTVCIPFATPWNLEGKRILGRQKQKVCHEPEPSLLSCFYLMGSFFPSLLH